MLRAVVADTGPLNYLVLIDQIDLLPTLFETVWVPDAVRRELLHQDTPPVVREWVGKAPSWLAIDPAPTPRTVDLPPLGAGERAAIALVLELHARLVLMDDRAGVAAARSKGIAATGTLGLLEHGARRGLLDLPTAFERLRKTTFHFRPGLLESVLTAHERFRDLRKP